METPQKRQRSWFSSLTGLVSGSRASSVLPSSVAKLSTVPGSSNANGDNVSKRLRTTIRDEETPSRHSGTFSAPAVESPESPAKRASPTLLAQRKIHGRVQGPSSRVAVPSNSIAVNQDTNTRNYYANTNNVARYSGTPKRTNFSSATTPRNMFRDSISREMPTFTFTPRVPLNTMRGNFPATTPGRSYRAPGIELSGREMAKTSSSDLFAMKIPDPDPELTGEAIANMIPKDLKPGSRSIYANEYLARFCPPDFNEEQRNQFFCILDLRRLKYAADEVFAKKDWKLNILNFAKEYEKNRSLIMLRYGLYEFKTVKVSKDVFQKWKAAHNIPDLDGEEIEDNSTVDSSPAQKTPASVTVSKLNGTEGILRTGKRKAEEDIDPSATSTSANVGSKRTRGIDGRTERGNNREPLGETATPSLNKSKRKTAAGQNRHAKQQKPAAASQSSAATPSATKVFLEKVANSPAKAAPAPCASSSAATPSIQVSKSANDKGPASTPSLFKAVQPSKPSNGSLARSVFENGLKTNSAQSNANIFGYLSDASSAKGSQNDNADADAEDTDESDAEREQSEAQGAVNQSANVSVGNVTPQPATALFAPKSTSTVPTAPVALGGSSASSEASEAPSRSIFDRINKGSDGQPLRMFGTESGSSSIPAPAATLFGSKSTSARASPEKESSSFSANKTWNPDTPIKFSAGVSTTPAKPLFGSSTSAANASPIGPAGSKDSVAPVTPAFSLGSITADALKPAPVSTPADTTGEAPKTTPPASTTPNATAPGTQAAAPIFSFLNKPTEPPATVAPSLFGSTSGTSAPAVPAAAPAPAPALFGKPQESQSSTSAAPLSLFGASAATAPKPATDPVLKSQTLFGQPQATKRTADNQPPAPSTIFGNAIKRGAPSNDEPPAKKSLFGSTNGSTPAASALFSFGAAKTNGVAEGGKASNEPAKPLFGSGLSNGTAAEPAKSETPSLFSSATPTPSAAFSFGSGSNGATQPSSSLFSFGTTTAPQQASATLSFGGGDTASAGSSFTFNAGGAGQSFNNPFASGGSGSQAVPSLSFGGVPSTTTSSSPFQFGGGGSSSMTPTTSAAAPSLFSFGAGSQPSQGVAGTAGTANSSVFGSTPSAGNAVFNFGGAASTQPSSGGPIFGQQKPASGPIFNLAPPMGGTSTGTDTPFTNLGGASSLATTPATGTPEPGATQDNTDHNGHQADGDEAPQEQISLTEGGPGEEDEAVVHEVRAKALKLVTASEGSDNESPAAKEKKKSPWKTEGVGPLRVLKHKTTGAIRLLLRAEPRGHVALNKALLPEFNYKPEPNAKYVKLTTANESGSGLETWMLQVKTKDAAQKLADVLEENKSANKK